MLVEHCSFRYLFKVKTDSSFTDVKLLSVLLTNFHHKYHSMMKSRNTRLNYMMKTHRKRRFQAVPLHLSCLLTLGLLVPTNQKYEQVDVLDWATSFIKENQIDNVTGSALEEISRIRELTQRFSKADCLDQVQIRSEISNAISEFANAFSTEPPALLEDRCFYENVYTSKFLKDLPKSYLDEFGDEFQILLKLAPLIDRNLVTETEGSLVSPITANVSKGEMGLKYSILTMLASQIHMLNNRLGVIPLQEYLLAKLLAQSLRSLSA